MTIRKIEYIPLREVWLEIHEEMINKMIRLEKAVKGYISKLNI